MCAKRLAVCCGRQLLARPAFFPRSGSGTRIEEDYGRWTKPLGGGRYAWGSPRLIFFRTKDLAEATEKAYDQEHRCISARNSGDAAPAKVPWVPNWHSNPIADRVRRKHQRLTPTHVIETASAPPFQLFSCSYRLGSSEQR